MLYLLQVSSSLVDTTSSSVVEQENLFELIAKGGLIMVPLALLLSLGIYVAIDRWLYIRYALRKSKSFTKRVTKQLAGGNVEQLIRFCESEQHPLARVMLKGLAKRKKSSEVIEKSMYSTAKLELFRLERKLSILSIIGYVAPLFGFLGTIIGMFSLFYNIAATGEYTISTIAGGIYIKMISSAAGLMIGLAAYIVYRILEGMLDTVENRMEETIVEFVDLSHSRPVVSGARVASTSSS